MQFKRELLFGDEARAALQRGIACVANPVKCTLGPKGRKVILDRTLSQNGTPLCTRDGVTVSNHCDAVDPFERLGAHLCREAANRTVDNAGDGTSATCLLVQEIVKNGMRMLASGANAAALERGIAIAAKAVEARIRRDSFPAGDLISEIARISSNGDEEISSLVVKAAAAAGPDGVMLIEESLTAESSLETVDGIRIMQGYSNTSPYFITNLEKAVTEFKNPLVLLWEGTLGGYKTMLPLLKLAAEAGRPLFIVAGDYSNEMLALLIKNKVEAGVLSCAIRSGAFGSARKELMRDIASLTGGTSFLDEMGRKLDTVTLAELGSADRVVVDRNFTTISHGHGKQSDLAARVQMLRSAIEETHDKSEKLSLEKRLAMLAGGIAVIRVGAATETAMREKKDRCDDALHAVRSAIETGVVIGGGVALMRAGMACESSIKATGDEMFGVRAILDSCSAPMRQIAENAGTSGDSVVQRVREFTGIPGSYGYNALTGKYGSLRDEGVLDPCGVVCEALRNASSIASLILTTECLSAEVLKEETSRE